MYAVGPDTDWGGVYGHKYDNTDEAELVHWFGVILHDGARYGSKGAICTRWLRGDPDHDDKIIKSMTFTCWRQIKSVLKLNCNISTPKRGSENYNPCSKYDYIFYCMCKNMNLFTKWANKDACVDETTWAFSGMGGEASGRVHNKPGVTKGGQTVILFDVGRCFP